MGGIVFSSRAFLIERPHQQNKTDLRFMHVASGKLLFKLRKSLHASVVIHIYSQLMNLQVPTGKATLRIIRYIVQT